jgi:enamine deaminase RidA (YjgF/YER057c/UK114 family)
MCMLAEAGGLAFLSGIVGMDAARGHGARGGIAQQARAIVDELTHRLALVKAGLERVAHLTIYVDDISAFNDVAPVLERAFGKRRPALAVLEVPRSAPVRSARMQAVAIAWLGEGSPVATAA